MHRMARLLLLASFAMACDDGPGRLPGPVPLPVPTGPSAPPPPAPPLVVRTISVGDKATGVFKGEDLAFEFTAPAEGRLVARLTWDVWFNGSLLTLTLGSTAFKPAPPDWSPLVGKWNLVAGERYRLTVGGGGTDWFYNDTFVLETALE
jgi:hypothetical protein